MQLVAYVEVQLVASIEVQSVPSIEVQLVTSIGVKCSHLQWGADSLSVESQTSCCDWWKLSCLFVVLVR